MLTLPDFKQKQVLFINSKDYKISKIKFINDNICLSENDKIVNRVSCHNIFAVFVVGDCSFTSVFIKKCKNYGVSIFLLNSNFRPYAKITAKAEGNYLLRKKQYANKNDLEISRRIVLIKINNQIALLKSIKKDIVASELEAYKKSVFLAKTNNDLLGMEGSASKVFFKNYFEKIGWQKRMPRSGTDIQNLLLDIGYTILFNFIDALLGSYGFDEYKGFYHKLFFQRKSLVCDVIEPFRCIIDKQLLKSYNLGQINEKDFRFSKGRWIILRKNRNKYLKIFLLSIMENKEKIFIFTRDFYYCVMNNSEFPEFNISKNL
jgi:CRISP-associated protein Cas1